MACDLAQKTDQRPRRVTMFPTLDLNRPPNNSHSAQRDLAERGNCYNLLQFAGHLQRCAGVSPPDYTKTEGPGVLALHSSAMFFFFLCR